MHEHRCRGRDKDSLSWLMLPERLGCKGIFFLRHCLFLLELCRSITPPIYTYKAHQIYIKNWHTPRALFCIARRFPCTATQPLSSTAVKRENLWEEMSVMQWKNHPFTFHRLPYMQSPSHPYELLTGTNRVALPFFSNLMHFCNSYIADL